MPTASAIAAQRPLETAARLTGGLLHQWQQRNVTASLPLAVRQLAGGGDPDHPRLAIPGDAAGGGAGPADYQGPVFMDSDIYKTLEAIGWELGRGPRPALRDFAASAVGLLEQVQQADGYLNSYVQATGEPRYSQLASSHEMYCDGHLIQAAIALPRAAGGTRALRIATRLADHLVGEFAGQEKGLDGHPIIETALAELYRETGEVAYLELARQFVDQRGRGLAGDSGLGRRYLQDATGVRDSVTEVGHVVRALYLEAGVTDVAVETGDRELLASSVRRWSDMVATKTYLTGGNGSRPRDQGGRGPVERPP